MLVGADDFWHGSSLQDLSPAWMTGAAGLGIGAKSPLRPLASLPTGPCKGVTGCTGFPGRGAILRGPDRTSSSPEGTPHACRACRSPISAPRWPRAPFRHARRDGLRLRRAAGHRIGGDIARDAVYPGALGLRDRGRADLRPRRQARGHPGRPCFPRPGGRRGPLVRGNRWCPHRGFPADRVGGRGDR